MLLSDTHMFESDALMFESDTHMFEHISGNQKKIYHASIQSNTL